MGHTTNQDSDDTPPSDGLAGFASRNLRHGWGFTKFAAVFGSIVAAMVFTGMSIATGFMCHKDDYVATVVDQSFFHESYKVTVVVDEVPGLVVKQNIPFQVWRRVKVGDKMIVRMTPRGTYKRIMATQTNVE
jgi:hypothetical protein